MTQHKPFKRDHASEAAPAVEDAAPNPDRAALATDAADYIAQMTAELAQMARTARLDTLAYFLEMARIEATSCQHREGRRQP